MAALYDNSAKGSSVALGSTLSTSSFTIAGSNRVLYAFVGSGSGGTPVDPSTVKWNTTESLSQIGTTITRGGVKFSCWRLIAPTAATSTVSITWGSNQDERFAIAISVKDCDQTTPNNTVAQATGTGTAATVSATSVSGDLVIDSVCCSDNSASNPTIAVNGGQTSRQEIEGATLAYEALGSSTLTATGTSTAMPWTVTSTAFGWGMFAFATNGAAAAATVINPFRGRGGGAAMPA